MWRNEKLVSGIRMCGYLVGVIFFVLLLMNCASAQQTSPWYRFTDAKSDLVGYKDASGKVMIPAKFGEFTRAGVFRNIIAVADPVTYKSYYLLKNGLEVARDSAYVFDSTFDCEQEGKIRFRDPVTDKVGYLGKDGQVSIPAKFNDARPFYNGVAVVLHNGNRICPDGSLYDPKNPCEHWSWDGITAMIDSSGTVIVDSVDYDLLGHLNWFSLQIDNKPANSRLHNSFKAKDGRFISFLDYEKEFTQWFYDRYLKQGGNSLAQSNFKLVSIEGLFKKSLRKSYSAKVFDQQYDGVLSRKLAYMKKHRKEIQIISEELNYMIYTQPAFKSFYTDCGEPDRERYPLFDVIVSYGSGITSYQERYSFLRTNKGYQLIGVTWRNLK